MKLSSTTIALSVIVFLIVTLSSIIVVFNVRNRIAEEDFVRNWANITEVQEEGTYLVYVYADWCPACQQIRNDVLAFYRDEPSGINLYYLDVDNTVGSPPAQFGNAGVPTMIVVEDGQWVNQVSGIEPVRNLLQSARDGELE